MELMNPRFALFLAFLPACIVGAAAVAVVKAVTSRDIVEEAKPGVQHEEPGE